MIGSYLQTSTEISTPLTANKSKKKDAGKKTGEKSKRHYSGISIKRTHYIADNSIRRTVWQGTDCFALRSNYLRKNLYTADISIKRTIIVFAPMVSAL